MRAIDPDRVSCLAFESCDRILYRKAGHQLYCANPKVFNMNGAVNCSHPAFADLANKPVSIIDKLTDHRIIRRVDQDQLRVVTGTDLYRIVVGLAALRADLHAWNRKLIKSQ